VKPGNSDLGQSAALLAGSAKIEPSSGTTAPPVEGDERFKPPGPELTPLKPMAQVEKQTPPSDAALEKIPDPLPTTSEKALPELSAAAPAEETKIAETPERIPIRPIARSNSTAAGQTEAAAAAEPAKAESKAPVRSVVPQPRPHPNLQPRFESDLNTADTGQPESLTTPIFSGAENPESVTYPEYLAPEIAMRDEDLELAEPAAESPDAQRQARIKFFGFVSCEIVVLALLVVSVLLGWSHRLGSGSLAKAGAIVAAIAAVALPIVFYGFPKTLPRDRHLNRSLGERYRLKRD
jgi:hypothetical protein